MTKGIHIQRRADQNCLVAGCVNPVAGRNLCNKHLLRYRKHGDPNFTKIAIRGQGDKWVAAHVSWEDKDACLLWPFGRHSRSRKFEYGAIGSRRAHAVMCEQAHGPKPTPLHEVAHSCDVPLCVNPHHLRWATRLENMGDMVSRGRSGGERKHTARLTEAAVRQIRTEPRGYGCTLRLADQFGVSVGTIRAVWRGDYWRAVK